ncbi:MAG: hypothetical protein ACKOXF_12300 [Chitinophagaceae bacterium]
MLKQILSDIRLYRQNYPGFFIVSVLVLVLYASQFLIKTEITPLGYFSLYSNRAMPQNAYYQILPVDTLNKRPKDIYQLKGTSFLMMEILPTRYEILANSDHCNQMNHRLRRIGLGDNNLEDCQQLQRFRKWLPVYASRIGMDLRGAELMQVGFNNGKIVDIAHVKDSAIFQ